MTEMERIIQDIRILARWDHIPTVVKKAIIQSKKREEIERSKKRVEEDKYLEGVEEMNEYYHCKTQEQYNWLMAKLDKEGYKWVSGDCLTGDDAPSHWSEYEGETVIKVIKELSFADLKFYKKHEFVTKFINVGELMKKESEENMPTKNVDEFLKKKIFIKVSDDINIELQAGELKIQSQVRENWIKDLRRGLDLIDNVLDYFESETKDA